MALILACWLGRHYLTRPIESHGMNVSSKNFRNYNKDKVDLGSGAPPSAMVSSRNEYMP